MEEFTLRSENIKYTKFVFKNVLLAITRADGRIEIDQLKYTIINYIRISMEMKKASDKKE